MSRPYRPSNGSEGDAFESAVCGSCRHYQRERDLEVTRCVRGIFDRAWLHDIDDPAYPKQFIVTDAGRPTCTAWRPRGRVYRDDRAAYEAAMRAVDT